MKPGRIMHQLAYAMRTVLLRRELPYLLGFQVTDRCNLDCFYCEGKNAGRVHLSFNEAAEVLREGHRRGHRSLYITGGEPLLWTDGGRNLGDLVEFAFSTGFYDVVVCTNGTLPLSIPKVSYVLTVDGPREIHNGIRGGTYDLIMENVRRSAGGRVIATITINKRNLPFIERYVEEISSLKIFRGIMFNTLTHWPEVVERYGLSPAEHSAVLDLFWSMKKRGCPVLLSRAAYRAFRNNSWKRPLRQIELAVGEKIYTCCRDVENREICGRCGYLGCVEISQILALKPSALIEVLKMTRGAI